jgi:hypothetical protein
MYVYLVRPRKDVRSVVLISDMLRFGPLWHGEPNAVSDAISYSSRRFVRMYDGLTNAKSGPRSYVAWPGPRRSAGLATLDSLRVRQFARMYRPNERQSQPRQYPTGMGKGLEGWTQNVTSCPRGLALL